MYPTIDLKPILDLAEGDPAFRLELLQQYRKNFAVFPAEFELALQSGHIEQIRLLVHKVKASVRMAGMDDLDRLLQKATQALPTIEQLGQMQQQVHLHCDALVAAIDLEISRTVAES